LFARLHTLETTDEQYERGFQIVSEELLPYARETTGFRGLIGLRDRENGKTLVLTLWADEEALERSAAAGDRLSALAADASGARRESLRAYEVTLFDVRA
jgi:heme-degrading monooxygenase HmoA